MGISVKSGSAPGGDNAFTTVQTPAGTSPVADSTSDTLTLTASDSKITITGNSTTDTIDLTAPSVVTGPASATSTAVALYDGTTGKVIKNSGVTVDSNNIITAPLHIFDPTKATWLFDDFDGPGNGSAGWVARNSGTGSGSSQGTTPDANAPGVSVIGAGTTTTGYALQERGIGSILFGGGAFTFIARVRFTALSTASEEYVAGIGFADSLVAGTPIDGIYFYYDRATHGDYWVVVTSSNSSVTTTVLDGTAGNPSVPIAANTWYKLTCTVNADATSVSFQVDSNTAVNVTTNIPTGASRNTGANRWIRKTAGTTNRTLETDYWYHYQTFTTPR